MKITVYSFVSGTPAQTVVCYNKFQNPDCFDYDLASEEF